MRCCCSGCHEWQPICGKRPVVRPNAGSQQTSTHSATSITQPVTMKDECGFRLRALALLATLAASLLAGAGATAIVQHSLDGRSFQTIGSISLEPEELVGTYERQAITDSELQQLRQLVADGSLYQWRVQLEGQPPVHTSIHAACLAEHLLGHGTSLALSSDGAIVAAQLSIPGDGPCSAQRALKQLDGLSREQLLEPPPRLVTVKSPAAGPAVPQGPAGAEAPDIATAGGAPSPQAAPAAARRPPTPQQQQQQKAGGSADGQAGGEGEAAAPPPDTRTWWQKNWLFVMAGGTMVLNIALKAAVGDPQQAGQPGAAAAAAGARRPGGGR